jgi:hypothetical protein
VTQNKPVNSHVKFGISFVGYPFMDMSLCLWSFLLLLYIIKNIGDKEKLIVLSIF